MELLGQDLYIVSNEKSLTNEHLISLTSMYMPLLSPLAVCLYFTLLRRPMASKNFDSHLHLCERLQCNIIDLQKARIELEHYLLLKTYFQSENNKKIYLYETQYPLSINSFLHHPTFARMLLAKVGNDYVDRYSQEVIVNHDLEDFREITERMPLSISDWTMDKETFYRSTVEMLPSDKTEDPYVEYDIISYLKINDPDEFMIPRSKISVKDVEYINSYGLKYQLRKEDMIKILHKNITRSTGKLDKEKFAAACASKSIIDSDMVSDYTISPLEFASFKVEGVLRSDEAKAIREIQSEYMLDNETMNFIIEKSIQNTESHRVVPNYISTVAKDFVTKKANSDTSTNVTKKKTTRTYRRVESVPEYEEMTNVPSVDMDDLKSRLEGVRKKRVM